jgi:putative transposase
MTCPHCTSLEIANRSRLTAHGYRTFFCKNCKHIFNERTGTPYIRSQVQTTTLFKVVFWRLRYKLSLTDLAEMFSVEFERFYFTSATIWRWQEKFSPLITDDLKSGRKGEADLRWKVDKTLVKVAGKFHYLYRAIDSKGRLVDTKLSPVRTSESTSAFFKQAVSTVGHKPEQVTTNKETSYPGAIKKVLGRKVKHRTGQYRNNRLEQDHRAIKGRYKVMASFKKSESAEIFCQGFDEQREFFRFRRWHKDRRSSGDKRADFKAKFYQLKNKFLARKLVWKQSAMSV